MIMPAPAPCPTLAQIFGNDRWQGTHDRPIGGGKEQHDENGNQCQAHHDFMRRSASPQDIADIALM
ncbi:hypothetical protein ACJU26_02265 [Acidithiobacillus sp. M4-SHS-6]|uniref:hypothetical protein n=1 Tax=Acidithiobacillus sp. M4-SHS-6 TaxID=3383024 RepID=UPI0039BDC5DA